MRSPSSRPTVTTSTTTTETTALTLAGLLGGLHAAFSLYWSVGGSWLTWSLGDDLVQRFEGREWLLAPVGAVKLLAALTPWLLHRWAWPIRAVTRSVCWVGAGVLVAWGASNTLVAHLVLAGAVRPDAGFDRAGMVGHAWIWDPLFLAWGAALAVGLLASRPVPGAGGGSAPTSAPPASTGPKTRRIGTIRAPAGRRAG